jgi:hypothetical protein
MTSPTLLWKAENNAVDTVAGLTGSWYTTAEYRQANIYKIHTLSFVNGSMASHTLNTSGTGYCFDMKTQPYNCVVIPYNSLFNFSPTGKFSLGFWVNASFATGNQYALVIKHDGSYGTSPPTFDTFGDWGIWVNSSQQPCIVVGDTVINITDQTMLIDTWYHILWTYNNGVHQLYVNGVLKTLNPTTPVLITQSTNPLIIGTGSYPGPGNWRYLSNAYLDEIGFYDEVIAPTEIIGVTRKTHTVVLLNGVTKSWSIVNGGTKPTPSNNHSIEVLKGSTQSWGIN